MTQTQDLTTIAAMTVDYLTPFAVRATGDDDIVRIVLNVADADLGAALAFLNERGHNGVQAPAAAGTVVTFRSLVRDHGPNLPTKTVVLRKGFERCELTVTDTGESFEVTRLVTDRTAQGTRVLDVDTRPHVSIRAARRYANDLHQRLVAGGWTAA